MDIGMLWYDNDPKADLASKITRAAEYYHKKYGQLPDLCCGCLPKAATRSQIYNRRIAVKRK